MKIMSINAGSSSLKFSLFDMTTEEVLISGLFERIGIEASGYTLKYKGEKIKVETDLPDAERKVSDSTGEDIPHGLRRFQLRVGGDVGVGVQREACGV